MTLSNKVAIVTGASAGLGTAFSRALAAKGATVYGLARRADRLHDLHTELGERFVPVVMDVTDRAALFAWVQATFNDAHRPDILVNNAGLGHFAGVDALTTELSGGSYEFAETAPTSGASTTATQEVGLAGALFGFFVILMFGLGKQASETGFPLNFFFGFFFWNYFFCLNLFFCFFLYFFI